MPVNRQSLIDADIQRALRRKHKKCKQHGDSQIVCLSCARIFCPVCVSNCPRCNVPAAAGQRPTETTVRVIMPKTKQYEPPPLPNEPRLRDVQKALLPFQIIGIERHADSGEWMALFPYRVSGYNTAADLAEQVLRQIKDIAVSTPYGSGRLFKPDRWFVSFKLKEVA
jgi:hypothetical protein